VAKWLGALVATAFVIGSGCGSDRPLVSDGTPYSGGTSQGGPQFDTETSTKPPGCGIKPDGSKCECLDVPLYVDPPTIYFVLDRSGSMGVSDKWNQVRVAVGKIMRGLGPRARFGATMFPRAPANDACAAGTEILSVRDGDPPSSGVDGPTTTALLTATRVVPSGGTPTGATLAAIQPNLAKLPGRTFVLLATDGAPNCNAGATCGFDQCQWNIENFDGCPKIGPHNCCEPPEGYRQNCNDTTTTLGVIASLKAAGVPVYVLGLPGSALYSGVLDDMATAGGTARLSAPKYFAVSAATEAVMLAELKKIAAQIAGTCVFDLKEVPSDPAFVNVYMDDQALPYEPVNGWTIDGKTVTLVGGSCARVKSGDVLDVRIISGCPRMDPR
jgi:hypothetical protein